MPAVWPDHAGSRFIFKSSFKAGYGMTWSMPNSSFRLDHTEYKEAVMSSNYTLTCRNNSTISGTFSIFLTLKKHDPSVALRPKSPVWMAKKSSRKNRDRFLVRINRHQPVPAYAEKHLFASCHGMILAIYDYGYYPEKEGVCAELALGKDTRKAASCLPCSLFISANGFPASATHLGRGDNWNYPLHQGNHLMTINWKKAAYHACQTGLTKLPALGMEFTGILEQGLLIEENPEKEIPLLFLEALTFEGSFIKKMIQVLSHFEQNIN